MTRPDPQDVNCVACVGGGYIGAGWAAVFLAAGKDVCMSDPGAQAADHAQVIIDQAWPFLEELGLADGASRSRFSFVDSMEEAVSCADFVQESAPDREQLKIDLFREMDAVARPGVILASSSSAFLPSRLQSGCTEPGRVVIGHPFAPSYLVPLVEVVGGSETDSDAMDWSMAFYESVGKKTLRLKTEIEAYVANRLQHVVFQEAARLVDQGVCEYQDIDTAVSYGPGLRWAFAGPVSCYHLGGGKGGVRHMIDHFGWGGSDESREKLIQSVDRMYGHLDIAELERWRDENLMVMLKGLTEPPLRD